MLKLASILEKMGPNGQGELLRAITFTGPGLGCYQNYDVRKDAIDWPDEAIDNRFSGFIQPMGSNSGDGKFISSWEVSEVRESFHAYTFLEDGLIVDVLWHQSYGHDGTLAFRVYRDGSLKYFLVNHDCKHDDEWRDITPPSEEGSAVAAISPDDDDEGGASEELYRVLKFNAPNL